jgi:hypothetical protein
MILKINGEINKVFDLSPRRLESAHADSNYRRHLTLEAVKPPPQGGRFEIFKGLKDNRPIYSNQDIFAIGDESNSINGVISNVVYDYENIKSMRQVTELEKTLNTKGSTNSVYIDANDSSSSKPYLAPSSPQIQEKWSLGGTLPNAFGLYSIV